MPIPRAIFQIALGEEYCARLPKELLKKNLLQLNPGYTYTLLQDKECVDLLSTHFPEHLRLYEAIPKPQHKSDLIRYLYAYKHGGYYVDIDAQPLLGFDELIVKMGSPNAFYTLGAHKRMNQYMECWNGFFGSLPNNPLLLEFVKGIYVDLQGADYGKNVKRMYSILSNTYKVAPFQNVDTVFFLEEYSRDGKYYARMNPTTDVCNSNGHNYPPKL